MSKSLNAGLVQLGTRLVLRSTFDVQILEVTGETKKHWKTNAGLKLRKDTLAIAGATPYDTRQVAPVDSQRGKAWLDRRAHRLAIANLQQQVKRLTEQDIHVQRVQHADGQPGPIDRLQQAVDRLRQLAEEN